jgi:hypothetical protein
MNDVLSAIRKAANSLGHSPSRSEFLSFSGMSEYHVLKHFPSWREAVHAAGLEVSSTNIALEPSVLLEDWGKLVRQIRRIPTLNHYRRNGTYSPATFQKKIGPWSSIPTKFRVFAEGKSEWTDVIALLPIASIQDSNAAQSKTKAAELSSIFAPTTARGHIKLNDRLTYGNPIDFRGLRHEPMNENGVVFLFGMVARELGYLVEAVQAGFPDCEAKRQIEAGKWQRVRIEFEFESRNFRDHGHPSNGCDVIVCWRHNWSECPSNLEVVELRRVIETLSSSED